MRRIILILFLIFLKSSYAQITVSQYKQTKDTNAMKSYVVGVGNGYMWSNVALRISKQKQLYCQPDKLSLGWDNYLNILETGIKDMSSPDSDPIEYVLLEQLRNTFPCR